MTNTNPHESAGFEYIATILDYMLKPFSFQNGSLVLIASASSYIIMSIFDTIIKDIDLRNIILPLTIFCILFLLYWLVSAIDFYTGLSASKKEFIDEHGHSKGYIDPDKLWSTVWKFLGVLIISTVLVIFTLIFAVLDQTVHYYIFMYALIIFFLIVILFDLHSIGNNQERRFGKKPQIYIFLEDIIDTVKNGIIKKIGKLFE